MIKYQNKNKGKGDAKVEEMMNYGDFVKLQPGDIVEGTVILVNNKELFVDLGYKSEGILTADEASFLSVDLKETYKVDDKIKVEVQNMNNGEGYVVLSRKVFERQEILDKLNACKEEGKAIEVTVGNSNSGGLNCSYGEIRVFMPTSQCGVGKNGDINELTGKKLNVKIIDIKEKRGNFELIVSRRLLAKEEREARRKEDFEKLIEGNEVTGTVKSIIAVGAFVSVGSIDIFVPISELSWKHVRQPQDVLSEGQSVTVKIIKVNNEEMKVTGSIKRLTQEPWEEFMSKYKEEDIIDVKVVRFTKFGAFAEIIDGVDGLIHISNIAYRRIEKPEDELQANQVVKAKIIKIDAESRKVSLSIKATLPAPETVEQPQQEAEAATTEVTPEETKTEE